MSNFKQFDLPDSIIQQINEFSAGGFVLVRLDEEGNPEVYSQFDTAINAVGLIRWIGMWANAVDQVHEENVLNSLEVDDGEGEDGCDCGQCDD